MVGVKKIIKRGGVKVVTFVGGYTDSTGDPTSTSRYSNIRLVGYQTV